MNTIQKITSFVVIALGIFAGFGGSVWQTLTGGVQLQVQNDNQNIVKAITSLPRAHADHGVDTGCWGCSCAGGGEGVGGGCSGCYGCA